MQTAYRRSCVRVSRNGSPLLSVVVLADSLRSAQPQCGLPPRLCGRHSGAKILVCLEREMFGEFILKALVSAPSGGEVREANEKAAQKSHARSSALNLKKRTMIAARGAPT
jgi:hypothetical protein